MNLQLIFILIFSMLIFGCSKSGLDISYFNVLDATIDNNSEETNDEDEDEDEENILTDTLAPTLNSISVIEGDGTYKIGDTLSIEFTFSENVIVTNTPQFFLETGSIDQAATYLSGSGTNKLLFNYTVQAGDLANDLNYINSAVFSNGTIADEANNLLSLNLPATNSGMSIGEIYEIEIDGVIPTVTTITSSTGDGDYTSAALINIEINFSEDVILTGSPQLTLDTGAVLNCTTQPTNSSIRCPYTVQATHNSADLNYVNTTSFQINGASIVDGAGNSALLTLPTIAHADSLAGQHAIVVDTTQPTADAAQTLVLQAYEAGRDDITSSGTIILKYSDNIASAEDLIFTVTTAGTKGILYNTNTSSTVAVTGTFTQEDIDNNYIEYRYNASNTELTDTTGTDTDSVIFSVSDGITPAITNITLAINIGHPCNNPAHVAVTSHTAIPKGSTPQWYFLCRPQQLTSLANSTGAGNLDQNYRLRNNIDMTSETIPHPTIGTNGDPFSGSFDGNDHYVLNFQNKSQTYYLGFFGVVQGDLGSDNIGDGAITRLHLENAEITAQGNSGLVVGSLSPGSLQYVSSRGKYIASSGSVGQYHGGLIGHSTGASASITSCWSDVEMTANNISSFSIGGLVGGLSGTITDSFALGNVITYTKNVGGLVGSTSGDVISSFATGNVRGGRNGGTGGLIGSADGGDIISSFATGNVYHSYTGSDGYSGGLIGWVSNINAAAIYRDLYATGNVFGSYHVGGLIGLSYKAINHSKIYATGSVFGTYDYVGGLIGRMGNGGNGTMIFSECFSLGDVVSTGNYVGGLVGRIHNSSGGSVTVRNCYARGSVNGSDFVGGFAGDAYETSGSILVENSYSTGDVQASVGATYIGAFVGQNTNATFADNFYDQSRTWATGPVGDGAGAQTTLTGVTGITTANMKLKNTFNSMGAGWDWLGDGGSEIWTMRKNNTDSIDYPVLTFAYKCVGDYWTGNPSIEDYQGTGTAADPIVICRPEQWTELAAQTGDYDKIIQLGEDIDMNAAATPAIGSFSNRFTGKFDGQARLGYRLIDFIGSIFDYVDGTAGEIFGSSGIVFDLSVSNLDYSTASSNGTNGAITGRVLPGSILHKIDIDGLSSISNTSTAMVCSGGGVGSMAGAYTTTGHSYQRTPYLIRSRSYATVNAPNCNMVGGFFGIGHGIVKDSYFDGSVTGNSAVGGFYGSVRTGLINGAEIHDSFSNGTVSATINAGGLMGTTYAIATVLKRNYVTNTVGSTTGATMGAIGGHGSCSSFSANNYWDVGTTGVGADNGSFCTASILGHSTAEMDNAANFSGWNFNTIWRIVEDSGEPPMLRWTRSITDSFEYWPTGTGGNDPPLGWTITPSGIGSAEQIMQSDAADPSSEDDSITDGTYGARVLLVTNFWTSAGVEMAKTFNLSGLNKLRFDIAGFNCPCNGLVFLQVKIDGQVIWSNNLAYNAAEIEVDIAGYSGLHEVALDFSFGVASDDYAVVYIDNLRLLP